MLLYCICVLAGAYALETFRQVPGDIVVLICALLIIPAALTRHTRHCACVLLGFVIMTLGVKRQLDDTLPAAFVGKDVAFSARVLDFPRVDGDALTFTVAPLDKGELPQRIRVSWYAAPEEPSIGERWRLTTRLRQPRGYLNVDGFDLEGWLFRERIGATAYVSPGLPTYRIHGADAGPLTRLRRAAVHRMEAALPNDVATGVLLAVAAGARHRISSENWALYGRTGTSHLMAISGLHIGLVAGYAFGVGWCIALVLGRKRNVRDVALIVALLAATGYATMSGLAVPAQRAWLMAFMAVAGVVLRRRVSLSALTALAGLVVFVAEPLAILTPGFKLSFCAVLVFVALSARLDSRPAFDWRTPVRTLAAGVFRLATIQVALLIGLFPLTALEFDRFPAGAPLTNGIVLPIFNLAIVPLTLAGVVLDGALKPAGDALLGWAHTGVTAVIDLLRWFDRFPLISIELPTLDGAVLWISFLPLLMLYLPPGWPGRNLGALAVLVIVLYRPAGPPAGCLDLQVLDVGQGQAILLRSINATLMYDTGPGFPNGHDLGESVIVPLLRRQGVKTIDYLIVSHADIDHIGGANTVLNALRVKHVLAGESSASLPRGTRRCVAGIHWSIDGVHYRILHPRLGSPWTRNNASCVIEATLGEHRVLLPGDIEAPVEKLLAYRQVFRRSSVVVVPHHGSKTSSTVDLVQATAPDIAVVTAGYGNRWGFPRDDMLDRWRASGTRIFNTAISGGLRQRFCKGKDAGEVVESRELRRKYWHRPG